MQSLLTSILMGLLRYVLAGVTGWMITHGIATEDQTLQLVAGIASAVVLAGSLVWVKYRDRIALLTALRMPARSTPEELAEAVKTGTVDPRVGLIIAVGLSSALLSGCASGQALVTNEPTPEAVQAVRQKAVRAADAVTVALGILDETGKLLDTLPIADATKDRYDCAILAVTGTSQPASPAVLRVCGAVPLSAVAPITLALESLRGVTTCPGLRATLSGVYGWVAPLITQLEGAESPALKMAGASLRITLSLLSSGGVSCV